MSRQIRIKAGSVEQTAVLSDTRTVGLIWDALPIKANGNTWGDEIYFTIPVSSGPEDAKEVVELGDIAFWPFCIFFGRTPASRGDEIRPASAVNVFGKLTGDPTEFRSVPDGAEVIIEKT